MTCRSSQEVKRDQICDEMYSFFFLLVKFLQAPADEAELLYRWHRYLLSTATKQLHKLWDAGSPVHGNEFNFSPF